MGSFPQYLLRGSQFFWTLLCTALIGNVIANAVSGNPSGVNYAIFVCVLSWLVLLLGAAALFMESLAIPIVLIAGDALATMFTFIAAVVLAAKLGVHSCANATYTLHNNYTNGSFDREKRCRELQASDAFFWFLFASFAGSVVLDFFASRGSTSMRSGGIRRGGPSMSQV
jgi:hypothetical protein